MKKTLKDFNFKGKRALVRVDFNVPLKDGQVDNDNRIVMTLPTIEYLVKQGAKVILMSHLGRPKGEAKKEFSMAPVAKRLSVLLGKEVKFFGVDEVVNDEVVQEVNAMNDGDVALLENLRFDIGEEKNHEEFAKKLASLGDIYVNDAFGTAHRAHASNVGVAKLLPSCSGFLVEKELTYLQNVLDNPKSPFIAILGGSKVSDKIGVIRNLLEKVDEIIIVGAMAFTFLKSQGYEVGKSLVEEDKLNLAGELLQLAKEKQVKLFLPKDVVAATECKEDAVATVVDIENIAAEQMGLDIGPKTVEEIAQDLKDAKTVVWNGPAGVFEMEAFSKGTFGIAQILADSTATVVIGGGDSASAVEKANLSDKMTHISTGGGASLEMLEGKVLPGIDAIEEK